MRGENSATLLPVSCRLGSPPHARGKFMRTGATYIPPGITPACAGKMLITPPILRITGDHPRMRGENVLRVNGYMAGQGSPPHARGKFVRWQLVPLPPGITPACAGKILCCQKEIIVLWDHPRMRGENIAAASVLCSSRGSPPHARGKYQHTRPAHGPHRITPACAGKIRCKA